MSQPLPAISEVREALPDLIDRARSALDSARTYAEVLEAKELAGAAVDAGKRAARLARAKDAFNNLMPRVHRAQADALQIEAAAKMRMADEYDAAQERGEVRTQADNQHVPDGNKLSTADLGISRKDIHEARIIRDAEKAQPGIVRDTLNEAVEAGEEPTRARVKRAALRTVRTDDDAPRLRPTRGPQAVAGRVREAIAALSGLPSPAEVLGYVRGTDDAILIDETLPSAARWLAEFSDLWGDE